MFIIVDVFSKDWYKLTGVDGNNTVLLKKKKNCSSYSAVADIQFFERIVNSFYSPDGFHILFSF